MVKKSFALAILISGLCVLPGQAQSLTQILQSAAGSSTSGTGGTGASAQYDPSSYIPFQTTESSSQVQTNGGTPITVDANVITGWTTNAAPPGTSVVNGLPQTSMDSFVYEAFGNAELIYGDEGVDTIPPYFEFDQTHRINVGITGVRAQGLSTGHSSMLPNAWGGDEWVKTEPFTMSGNGEDIGTNGQLVQANGQGTNGIGANFNVGGLNINANTNTGLTVGGVNLGSGVGNVGLNLGTGF